MRKFGVLFAAVIVLAPATAFAQDLCTVNPGDQMMTAEEAKQKMIEAGYTDTRKVEEEHGCSKARVSPPIRNSSRSTFIRPRARSSKSRSRTSIAMADSPASSGLTVYVWDVFVRLFHWGVFLFFFISYFEATNAFVHENAGYIVLGLVVLRVLWGFCGPQHARFANFIRPPSAAIRYLIGLPRGRAERHVGHNPAGAWMVIILLVMLAVVSVSGILMRTDRFWADPLVEDIHYVSADITLGLIVLHVCGVIASSLAHRALRSCWSVGRAAVSVMPRRPRRWG